MYRDDFDVSSGIQKREQKKKKNEGEKTFTFPNFTSLV